MATVMITVLLTTMMMVAAKEDYTSFCGPAARHSKHKHKHSCPWTSWCCKQAPTGWQLFQLVFPWFIMLALCMPCIGATGHNIFRTDVECLQSSLGSLEVGVMNPDKESMPVASTMTNGLERTTQKKDAQPGGSGLFIKAPEVGNFDLIGGFKEAESSDTGVSVAEEEPESRSLASNMLECSASFSKGRSHVQQVLLSTSTPVESAAQFVVQASSSQEWIVSAILDWGSHALYSASLKFLTIVNAQKNTRLFIFKPFSSNTQFCTVGFQEAVVPPGGVLSIPVVYVPMSIGKAEGMIYLQTSAGGYLVETVGEGIPFPYKLHPLSGLMVVLKAEVQQAISFYNPFDVPLFVKEAYAWVESSNRFSTCSQAKGEGVLCKIYVFMARSSYLSRLTVRPTGDWVVAPHSLSPIVDLGILVNDGEHLVGTLCLKIYRYSMQIQEMLVVPLKTEWVCKGNDSAKNLARTNFLNFGVLIKTEQESKWAVYLVNSGLVPLQASKAFALIEDNNLSHISFTGELILDSGTEKQVATITLSAFECKACCLRGFCVQNKFIVHINGTIDTVVEVPYAVLILLGAIKCAAIDLATGILESRMRLGTFLEHTCNVSHCENHFNMPSAPSKERTMRNGSVGIENVHGPKSIDANDIDCSHLPWENHIHVLSVAAQSRQWLNVSNLNGKSERVQMEGNTCQGFTVLISVDLTKAAQRYDLDLQGGTTGAVSHLKGTVILCPKSGCVWPSLVLEESNLIGIECGSVGSSGSRVLRFWDRSNPELSQMYIFVAFPLSPKICAVKQHRDTGTETILAMQETKFFGVQISVGSYMQMQSACISNCGLKSNKLHSCYEQATECIVSHQPDHPVGATETSFQVHCVPLILPALSFPVYTESAPFYRFEKLLLKVFLTTLISMLVMLLKMPKQERNLAMDARLWHSCNYTVFLQSIYSKTGCIKASDKSCNFEHALDKLNSTRGLVSQNDQPQKRNFPDVKARVARTLGFIFGWFFDSQATILNVRVQIAESSCDLNAEQSQKTVSNGFTADDKNCGVAMNTIVEKLSHLSFTNKGAIEGTSCTGITDPSNASGSVGQKHLEPSALPLVTLPSTCPSIKGIIESSPSIKTLCISEGYPHKEKKDRGKRRKRRSNIIDLRQESERGGQSGSSSPPSSPASPATPLSYSPISPFLQSDSPSNSVKGPTCSSGSQSFTARDSVCRDYCIQLSNETLSHLDVHGDHVYMPSNKARIHHLDGLGSKANIETLSSKLPQVVGTIMSDNGVVMDSAKDRTCIFVGENWASVARRAIATSEADQLQGLSPSRRDGTRNKPVLLPSATFPQGGRSMHWSPQLFEEKIVRLNDPMSSPSLVSTSLVAPNARAPGSKPAKQCNEKPSVRLPEAAVGQSNVGNNDMSAGSRKQTDLKSYDFLYDIWGDHFAEISRCTQPVAYSSYPIREDDSAPKNSTPSWNPQSFFAASEFMIPSPALVRADAAVLRSSSTGMGFSIFSSDTIFSPCQLEVAHQHQSR